MKNQILFTGKITKIREIFQNVIFKMSFAENFTQSANC